MKNLFVFAALAVFILLHYSCKKCYECTRPVICKSCTRTTGADTTLCATAGETSSEFDTRVAAYTTYTCTSVPPTVLDSQEICDGSLLSIYGVPSIDKITLESKGYTCVKK